MDQNNKKKHISILKLLFIFLIFLFLVYLILFKISTSGKKVWQNGQVIIDGQVIQLPISIEQFEKNLNVKIDKNNYVKLDVGYSSPLEFSVMVTGNKIIGITIYINSRADLINDGNERSIAKKIIFPGDINCQSDIAIIRKTYDSKPINAYFNMTSEDIGNYKSTYYKYQNNESGIEISTKSDLNGNNEEINRIFYWKN